MLECLIFLLKTNHSQRRSNSVISNIEKEILVKMQPVCNKENTFHKSYHASNINTSTAISIISRLINGKSKINSWEYLKFSEM